MMAKKIDRRVRRTRKRLRNALIELILEQGYESITIQEITDRADLSRATFYLHYQNGKDELLGVSLEAMFDELVESVQDLVYQQNLDSDEKQPPSLLAFKHVQEYSNLYKSLLGNKGVSSVIYRTLDYIARISRKQLDGLKLEHQIDTAPIPIELAAQHSAGSLFAMVSWWLENDMPYSAEEMAQFYQAITVPSIRAALGIERDKSEPSTYP
ncbi:MAG: TetR/AcrR family transcriptional regulator [Anaerolineae bacterium]|nr:TetR/AcrR family transcriptional regulator [Anaerolineae bacterium]MDQ7033325.1 TetR/AcrR family transcriptional regulator [Anaerolineae bacterium]